MKIVKRQVTGAFVLASVLLVSGLAWAGGGGNSAATRVKIRLAGPSINGIRPEGSAEYRTDRGRSVLEVEAERVNLPDGTPLVVKVNQTTIGTLILVAGCDELELRNSPAPHAGDVITVQASNGALTMTVLQGHF